MDLFGCGGWIFEKNHKSKKNFLKKLKPKVYAGAPHCPTLAAHWP
jgi:hypothetical protein